MWYPGWDPGTEEDTTGGVGGKREKKPKNDETQLKPGVYLTVLTNINFFLVINVP